ncbi:MAG: type II secretion system protein GspD, partial [Candidatus Omnitrophica bacterium]|nr:type II secretion system protein GspD [Candidatus Omnitrophota bacterium]
KPLETFVYTLQYANADVVADKLRSRIDAKAVGSITPDERSNKLIVRAFPERRKEIESIVKLLDTPTKEVLVDARILQIVMKPEYDVGIDWQLDFRDSNDENLRKLSFSNFYLGQQNSSISASDSLYNNFGQIAVGDFDQDVFEMRLRSLEAVSDTKILSNPKILVTNKEEAKIHIGDTVPYIISTTSGTGDNAITSEDVRFVDVGLKLNVTPIINDDGMVTMRLRPEISTVVGTISSQGGGIPQVNKTEVETTVMVQDGNTIIMGGLKKDDKSHTKKGFPVLMDLPVFGPFFGRQSDEFNETEIVIFITPHVLYGDEDYNDMKGTIKPFKSYSTD